MTEEYSMEFTKEDELLDHIAELEKENAELKKKCYKKAVKDYCELEKKNAELEAELKKWKDEWQEQVQKENDESYARTLQTMQLSKAKEIIKGLLSFVDSLGNYSGGIFAKAEQFLSDSKQEG